MALAVHLGCPMALKWLGKVVDTALLAIGHPGGRLPPWDRQASVSGAQMTIRGIIIPLRSINLATYLVWPGAD